jgi:hypothetical protein
MVFLGVTIHLVIFLVARELWLWLAFRRNLHVDKLLRYTVTIKQSDGMGRF